MEHLPAALAAALLVAYGLVARQMTRLQLTGPMLFTAAGVLLGPGVLGLFDVGLDSESTRLIAEVTLVLVLFGDASRLNFAKLRHQGGLPARMLLIGMPLIILAVAVAARWLFPGISWSLAALLGAVLAPTDAALGQAVITDERIPVRIRQALNVESGLNDGLAAPVFGVLLAAVAGVSAEAGLAELIATEIGLGALSGLLVGGASAVGLRATTARDWTSPEAERIVAVAAAVLAWALAYLIGGNGFIAAFTGGLVWAATSGFDAMAPTEFLEGDGQLVSLLVWLLFGALIVDPMLSEIDWQIVAFAVVALTIARMVPIAAATAGAGLRLETVGLLGWFGPRGLASIVFALEAIDTLGGDEANTVLVTVGSTVLASVFAHGVTAGPLAAWYARRLAGQPAEAPEMRTVPAMRARDR
jgi:NhaP-type Na+/H+ or K+/H+ antiporter